MLAAAADDGERAFRLGWSRWCRAHEAVAQRCHSARRAREEFGRAAACIVPAVGDEQLTDVEWERVRPLLPSQRPRTGRPRHDHRAVLGGILWVLRTASPWREMPPRFGKWDTAYARYRLWRRQGLWQRLIDALGIAGVPKPMMNVEANGEVSL